MHIENSAERYRFSCRSCAEQWDADYRVRTVTHPDGDVRVLYWLHGLACEAPSFADVVCRGCHRGTVAVSLVTAPPA